MNSSLLASKINTYLGGLLVFAFGLFILTIGFKLKHMVNPIAEALAGEEAMLLSN